ncbi:MAG: hypothetical protein ACI9S8_002339 [Chlamydiales bacterium]|jgi:hypothetical protein
MTTTIDSNHNSLQIFQTGSASNTKMPAKISNRHIKNILKLAILSIVASPAEGTLIERTTYLRSSSTQKKMEKPEVIAKRILQSTEDTTYPVQAGNMYARYFNSCCPDGLYPTYEEAIGCIPTKPHAESGFDPEPCQIATADYVSW